MRLALALGLLSLLVPPLVPAQQTVQGPEPGVFIYGYDEATSLFSRTYHATQQEAQTVLAPRWAAAEAVAAQLNQQVQANVNTRAVAEWMVFCEQWHYWQEWVKQEYELEEAFDSWLGGQGSATFAALPGTTLWWQRGAAPALGAAAPGPAAQGLSREQLELSGVGGEFGGVAAPVDQGPAPPEEAAITLETFLQIPVGQRQQGMQTLHGVVSDIVQALAEEKYETLYAILGEVEESQESRARRAAYLATRQRDITDLREIILNEENATRVTFDDTTYLFSEQPLNRIPPGAINITTPNLTPYDLFNSDGSARSGQ